MRRERGKEGMESEDLFLSFVYLFKIRFFNKALHEIVTRRQACSQDLLLSAVIASK